MSISSCQLLDLQDLRNHVNITLCNHESLEVGEYPITERILMRGDKPCGMFFCLHGPREVKFTAIWESDRNTILFYDSGGDRFGKTQLVVAPDLEHVASQRTAPSAGDGSTRNLGLSPECHLEEP